MIAVCCVVCLTIVCLFLAHAYVFCLSLFFSLKRVVWLCTCWCLLFVVCLLLECLFFFCMPMSFVWCTVFVSACFFVVCT